MSRLLPTALAALAVASAGVLAACGSSGSSSTATTAAPAAPATTPASTGGATPPANASGTVAISMKDIAFNPKDATVKVGQKVVWTNDDSVQHDAVADDGQFKSKLFGQGGTYTFTPTKPGTIKYVCTIHPGMDGTLVVTK